MKTQEQHNAEYLAEAQEVLVARGNETDKVLFDRLGGYALAATQDTVASANGIVKKRRRIDMISDAQVADELALILSWRLNLTPSFWKQAGYVAATTPKGA